MKKYKFIQYGKPNLGPEENSKLKSVIKSNWFGTGPIVHQFEKIFSRNLRENLLNIFSILSILSKSIP